MSEKGKTGRWRQYLPWMLVVAGILALLIGRVTWSARQELEAGKAAVEQGDQETAVLHFGRAAHWYSPGSPYVSEALEELYQIGRQAEMEGHVELALSAYRTTRRSCLGTRSFYTPHPERLDEANRRIASLLARQDPPPMDRGKSLVQRRDEHLALLEDVDQPHPFWAVIACFSFILWVGGGFGFALKAMDKDLHIRNRPATIWGGLVVVGLTLWVVSLLLA